MNKEDKEKIKNLLEEWKKEAIMIKEENNQPKNGARLDGGNSGKYTELTKKYQRLIEERLNYKIWNK